MRSAVPYALTVSTDVAASSRQGTVRHDQLRGRPGKTERSHTQQDTQIHHLVAEPQWWFEHPDKSGRLCEHGHRSRPRQKGASETS